MRQPPPVILVHGAYHGAWCWDRVVPHLTNAGLEALAVDLPGHGASPLPLTDLYGDAAHVRSIIAGFDEPPVVVGHSYGGAVITEAAIGVEVAHMLFVAAVAPEAGKNAAGQPAGEAEPPTAGDVTPVMPERSSLVEALYHDCPPEEVAAARAKLVGQHPLSMQQPVREATWRSVPSTYVVCTEDRVIPAAIQRRIAGKMGASVELRSGHSPFFSCPKELADIIARVAEAARR